MALPWGGKEVPKHLIYCSISKIKKKKKVNSVSSSMWLGIGNELKTLDTSMLIYRLSLNTGEDTWKDAESICFIPLGSAILQGSSEILGSVYAVRHSVSLAPCQVRGVLGLHVPLLLEVIWARKRRRTVLWSHYSLFSMCMFGHILKPLFPQPWNLLWVVSFCLVSAPFRAFPTCIYKPIWVCWGSSWRIGSAIAVPGPILLWTSCFSSGFGESKSIVGNDIHNSQWHGQKLDAWMSFEVFLFLWNEHSLNFLC